MPYDRRTRPSAPVHVTVAVLERKWAPGLIDLLRSGPRRFNELHASLPRVAHKVLVQQLRALERDGVIARHAISRPARAVLYQLTEPGVRLLPILDLMDIWGREQRASP